MIARQNRFHGFNALRHIYTRGQTVRGSFITTKYLLNPRRDSYRVAVVVSRKVHKSAVVRNRIRRRLYEIVRKHANEITGSYDLVLTVFSDTVATMEAGELEKMVTGQLQKAKIMRRPARSGAPQRGIVKGIDLEEHQ